MYTEQDQPRELDFPQKLKGDLRTVAIWARVAAIFSFITTACAFVQNAFKGLWPFVFITIICGIFTMMAVYLFNFGNKTKKGLESVDQNNLEDGFDNLRLYFKMSVRVLIAALSLIVLIVIISLFSSRGVPAMY